MPRLILRAVGPPMLIGGLLLSVLWYFRPPPSHAHWLVVILLLTGGGMITGLGNGWRRLPITLLLGILLASLLTWQLWPGSDLLQVQSTQGADNGLWQSVDVQIPPGLVGDPPSGMHPLQIRPGLKISLFVAGLDRPRMLAFSPAGDLYVSLPQKGQVVVLPDADNDGVADRVVSFADNLDLPHGLTFVDTDLIVAETGRLLRLPDRDGNLKADQVEILSHDLPPGRGHWTRSVTVGPRGDLFVSAGSSCNVCVEEDPRRGTVMRIKSHGGPVEIYAKGLRNSVGLAFHPQTGDLWASNNGRDRLGDDLPPEEINRIVQGGDYGWPYCYGQRIPDPDFGSLERCQTTLPPAVEMQAHSAPLGIAFGYDLDVPERYRSMLYVAFHGSWNRSVPTGYKLIGVPFEGGQPSGPPEDVVRGWLRGRSAWGRPVAPVVGPDGALYLSDDRAGVIYRISKAP